MRQLIQKVAELGMLTRNYQPRYMPSRLNYDIPHCRELAQLEAMILAQKGFRRSPAGTADTARLRHAYATLGVEESPVDERAMLR